MGTVLSLKKRLETLNNREKVYGLFFGVVKRFEAYLIDLNLIRLEEGQDVTGKVTGTYSRATELESLFGAGPRPIKPKIQGQPYNFQWTGGLFDGMKINLFGDRAEFTSTDSKAPELIARYGELFGLQERDLVEALQDRLYPGFMELLRNQLQV